MARSHQTAVRAAMGGTRSLAAGGTGSGIGNRQAVPTSPIKGKSQALGTPTPPPGPQAGTQGTAMPWDSQAEIKATGADTRYNDYKVESAGNRDFRERYYGLSDGYNDPTANPWSQAALLAHQHEVGQRGVREGGAGNQLYAGSTINRERAETRRAELALQTLKGAYESEKAGWARDDQEARHRHEEERDDAQIGAIDRAAEAPLPVLPASGSGAHAKTKQNKKTVKYGVSKGRKA